MNKFDIKSINSIMSEEIEHFSSKSYLKDEEGKVISIGDGIAKVSGLKSVMLNEIVRFETGVQGIVLNLEKDVVGVVLLGKFDNIEEGNIVYRTYKVFEIPVGFNFIGRTIDATGKPIDGKGPINYDAYLPIEKIAPGVMARESVNEPLETGILSIDSMFPIGKGQRELIIGDRQTGKTTIATDTIINQKGRNVYCIYVAIGQKNSTIAALARNLEEQGAMEYTTIVSASASDLPALQYIAPYAGVTLAEYLMSQGKNVLIVYDDLSKHAVAYRTLSLLLKRPPGREAYPGDVFYLHSRLLERACKLNKENGGGSITALPIIETQAGDISAYIPTNVISITDGQIFMMSSLFNAGQRPAIDAGLSVSRVGGAAQIKSIKQMSSSLKLELASYRELDSFSQFGSDLDDATKATLEHGERIMQMLRQLPNKPYSQTDEAVLLFSIKERFVDMVPTERIIEYKEFLLKKIHNQRIWTKLDEQKEFTKDELIPAFKSSVYDITLEFLGLIKQELDAEEYEKYLEKLLTLKPEQEQKELEIMSKVDEVELIENENDTLVVIEEEDKELEDKPVVYHKVESELIPEDLDEPKQVEETSKEKIYYSFGDIEDPDNIKYFDFDNQPVQNHRVLIQETTSKPIENSTIQSILNDDVEVKTINKQDPDIEYIWDNNIIEIQSVETIQKPNHDVETIYEDIIISEPIISSNDVDTPVELIVKPNYIVTFVVDDVTKSQPETIVQNIVKDDDVVNVIDDEIVKPISNEQNKIVDTDTPVELIVKQEYDVDTIIDDVVKQQSDFDFGDIDENNIEYFDFDEQQSIQSKLKQSPYYSFGDIDQNTINDQFTFDEFESIKDQLCDKPMDYEFGDFQENEEPQSTDISIKDQFEKSNINFEFDDIEDPDNVKYFDFDKKQNKKQSDNSNSIFKVNENWGNKISEEEILKREKETLKVVKEKDLVSKSSSKEKIDKITDITIMISLSLEEATNIIENGKTVLFFKKLPVQDVKRVIVYLVKNKKTNGMVIGEFILDKKEKLSRTKAWNEYGKLSTLKKSEFTEYFKDEKSATIMLISDFFQYRNPRELQDFGISKGPAGFVYLK